MTANSVGNEISKSGLIADESYQAIEKEIESIPDSRKAQKEMAKQLWINYRINAKKLYESALAKRKKNAKADVSAEEKAFAALDKEFTESFLMVGLPSVLECAEKTGVELPWKSVSFDCISNADTVNILAAKGYDFNSMQVINGKTVSLAQVLLDGMKEQLTEADAEEGKLDTLAAKHNKMDNLRKKMDAAYESATGDMKIRIAKDLVLLNVLYGRQSAKTIASLQHEDSCIGAYENMEKARQALLQSNAVSAGNKRILQSQAFDTLKAFNAERASYRDGMFKYFEKKLRGWTEEEIKQKLKKSNQTEKDVEKFEKIIIENGLVETEQQTGNSTLAQNSGKPVIDIAALGVPTAPKLQLGTHVLAEEGEQPTATQTVARGS